MLKNIMLRQWLAYCNLTNTYLGLIKLNMDLMRDMVRGPTVSKVKEPVVTRLNELYKGVRTMPSSNRLRGWVKSIEEGSVDVGALPLLPPHLGAVELTVDGDVIYVDHQDIDDLVEFPYNDEDHNLLNTLTAINVSLSNMVGDGVFKWSDINKKQIIIREVN